MRQITLQLTAFLSITLILGGCGTIYSRSNDTYSHDGNIPAKNGENPSKVYSGVSSDIKSLNPQDSIPVLIDLPMSLVADTFLLPITLKEQNVSNNRLQNAAAKGDIVAVRNLLQAGAKIDEMDAHGHTALMSASWGGHVAIVQILLAHKPSINARHPGSGESALNYIIKKKTDARARYSSEIVDLLLQAGADIDFKNNDGGTALIQAVRMQNDNLVTLLLERGADANIATVRGDTALLEASWSSLRYMDVVVPGLIVKTLLDHGANVNARNKEGRTPLQSAISADTDVMTLLLTKGADPNLQGECGGTPLMYAAEYGYTQAIKLLLNSGAKVNAKYSDICRHFNNETAMSLAKSNNQSEAIGLLKKAGAVE